MLANRRRTLILRSITKRGAGIVEVVYLNGLRRLVVSHLFELLPLKIFVCHSSHLAESFIVIFQLFYFFFRLFSAPSGSFQIF
jgi:hypothetical protein